MSERDTQLLTTAEACRRLGVHRVTLYRHIASGELEARRLGTRGNLRIPVDAIERFLGVPAPGSSSFEFDVSPSHGERPARISRIDRILKEREAWFADDE
jgi:excisionase family DNA binding protein